MAKEVLARGDVLIGVGRSADKLASFERSLSPSDQTRFWDLPLDVTAGEETIKAKVASKVNEMAGHRGGKVSGRGGIDVLVNNAGLGFGSTLEEGGSDLLRKQFSINVFGVMDVTVACLPFLRTSQNPTLAIVGSRSGWRTDVPGLGMYSASKAAVHSLAETWAVELAPFNIPVILIQPGSFPTEGIYDNGFILPRPLPQYEKMRGAITQRLLAIKGTERGDPDKASSAIIDAIRGEGVSKGRKMPLYLFLGQDAEADVRAKTSKVLGVLDQWVDVTRGVCIETHHN